MNLQEVNITTIETETGQKLFDTSYRVCAFCDKVVRASSYNFKSCENLAQGKYYCPFCLRNNHHYRSSRHVLGFSFRGIIGFYYYRFYAINPRQMYLTDLESLIEKNANLGLQSPVLTYDPSIFMWYADFNKIGNHKSKAPYEDLQEIVKMMICNFNLKGYVTLEVENSMLSRFQKAMDLFYQKRQRPNNRRMLIPTLNGLVHSAKNEEFFDSTRNFVKNCMILK